MSEQPSAQYSLPGDAVWFITGCSSGIGQALSKVVVSKGMRLIATARKIASLDYLPENDSILKLALDVSSKESVDSAMATALTRWGRLDVVVNNAGFTLFGDTENATEEDSHAIVNTNLWGPIWITKHALRILRDENPKTGQQGGVILNVTSFGGRVAFPGNAFYHLTKFGLEGFTEAVSQEVRPEWNIHFALIEPGGTQTNYVNASTKNIEPHPAYGPDSATRVLERYVADPESQKTWATADSVANAIFEVARRQKQTPLRVPLGEGTWRLLKSGLARVEKDLDEVKDLAYIANNNGAGAARADMPS